jgi:hypothetical protein
MKSVEESLVAFAMRPPAPEVSSRTVDSRNLERSIAAYSTRPQTSVSLKGILDFSAHNADEEARLMASARFVHMEMPIRLAARAAELNSLPLGLCQMVLCLLVTFLLKAYLVAFDESS